MASVRRESAEEIYYPICGIYNKTPERNLPPGLYLGLLHGRRPANEPLNGWGMDGPIIGPLAYVHTTYAQDIQLALPDGTELESLDIGNGLLEFNGMFYGDWTVFTVGENATAPRKRSGRR